MRYEEVEVNSERWFDLTPLLNEEFRDIYFVIGEYQVSNYGRVKSLKNKIILKNSLYKKHKSPYYRVHISSTKYNINKMFAVHRLVAIHFIENTNNYSVINHIDGNRYNNLANNLEWCTIEYNNRHAFKNGLIKIKKGKENHMYGKTGKLNPSSKPVIQFDKNNNFIKEWECMAQVEREIKVNQGDISECCRGRRKTAGSYIWKFKEVNHGK